MNVLWSGLTHLERFVEWLLRTSFEASLLVVLILILRFCFRNVLPMRWRYVLWMLLVVCLLLPALPHLPGHPAATSWLLYGGEPTSRVFYGG